MGPVEVINSNPSIHESLLNVSSKSVAPECCIDFQKIVEKIKMVAFVIIAVLGTLALCSIVPNFFFYGMVIGFLSSEWIEKQVEKVQVFIEKSNVFIKIGLGVIASICFIQATTTFGFLYAAYLGAKLASPQFNENMNNFFNNLAS